MKLNVLILLALMTYPVTALAADPSWFMCRVDSAEVHVPNIIVEQGERIPLSRFAPAMGKAYAKNLGVTQEFYVIPVMVIGGACIDQDAVFFADTDRGRVKATDAEWVDGTRYPVQRQGRLVAAALAVFPKTFRLKDVIGFTMRSGGIEYRLEQESPLK